MRGKAKRNEADESDGTAAAAVVGADAAPCNAPLTANTTSIPASTSASAPAPAPAPAPASRRGSLRSLFLGSASVAGFRLTDTLSAADAPTASTSGPGGSFSFGSSDLGVAGDEAFGFGGVSGAGKAGGDEAAPAIGQPAEGAGRQGAGQPPFSFSFATGAGYSPERHQGEGVTPTAASAGPSPADGLPMRLSSLGAPFGGEPAGGVSGGWSASPAQAFMRQQSEEELRENWVMGRRDARAAYKKRHQDAVRQQKLRSRRGGGNKGGGGPGD